MTNYKKEEFAYTELLQVRISPIFKKKIDKYIQNKIKEIGTKYSQSEFLREAISIKLMGKEKNIEEKMVAGLIMGEKIKEAQRKGDLSETTMTKITADILLQDEKYKKQIQKIRNNVINRMELVTLEESIRWVEESNAPLDLKKRIVDKLKKDFEEE